MIKAAAIYLWGQYCLTIRNGAFESNVVSQNDIPNDNGHYD